MSTYESALRIAADHPALPGHFPGEPIAPGVLLLDLVLDRAERWLGAPLRIAALRQVKFTAPLLPEQEARLRLDLRDEELRFAITRDGAAIAQGVFRLAAGRAP
jgi:3-hydroxyacyl-[acyl-carrier-protein] dehydratase